MRLESIKSWIIVFTLFATLIPSLVTGGLFHVQNRRFLRETIAQELQSATSQAAREADLWLKERLYEVRVFTSSSVVSESLGTTGAAPAARNAAARRLAGERPRRRGHDRGAPLGRVAAGRRRRRRAADRRQRRPVVGAVAATLNFSAVATIIGDHSRQGESELHLVDGSGVVIASSTPLPPPFLGARLPAETAGDLFARQGEPVAYAGVRGAPVVGVLRVLPRLG